MRLKKIISGGQTGADQGGLHGAKRAGLATGGTAPREWRTETGPNQDLKHYGLVESQLYHYSRRTHDNIVDSDGTLIFGDQTSKGSALTIRMCKLLGKPFWLVPWKASKIQKDSYDSVRHWIKTNDIETLNIAGNRESKNPGIHDAVSNFIVELIGELEKESCSR